MLLGPCDDALVQIVEHGSHLVRLRGQGVDVCPARSAMRTSASLNALSASALRADVTSMTLSRRRSGNDTGAVFQRRAYVVDTHCKGFFHSCRAFFDDTGLIAERFVDFLDIA